jgi:hemerythrin-like domain-containing protein
VKRHPHLQPLSDDHHGALVLARRIGRAAEQRGAFAEAWQELQRRFDEEVEPHFRVEEQRLLPPLEAAGEQALVERTRGDHARLRTLVRAGPDPGIGAELAELLRRHVRFEERELFPRAESVLDPSVLEAVANAALAARTARDGARPR